MKKKVNTLYLILVFSLALTFVVYFGGPNILKAYIKAGIGDCEKIPLLCRAPSQEILNPLVDREYAAGLIPYKFSKLSISAPKGFAVIQELEKKPYYKKRPNKSKESVIFTFRQDNGYFLKLFPQAKALGVKDNFEFINKLAQARIDRISNIEDAFFVILKSIFTPDLGDQEKVVMAYFEFPDRKGFINYNLFDEKYYFECNLVDNSGDFFKVYIKDVNRTLELKEVFAIISTLKR